LLPADDTSRPACRRTAPRRPDRRVVLRITRRTQEFARGRERKAGKSGSGQTRSVGVTRCRAPVADGGGGGPVHAQRTRMRSRRRSARRAARPGDHLEQRVREIPGSGTRPAGTASVCSGRTGESAVGPCRPPRCHHAVRAAARRSGASGA
jgi:hypothetical protein